MIGTFSCTPIASAPQPHWKTATITPYAAPMLSMLRTAAFNGTSTERKTSISTRNDSPTTAPRNQGIRWCNRDDTSSIRAVEPVTDAVTSEPSIAAGMVSLRMRRSSSLVRSSCGEVVGMTPMMAMSPASLVSGSLTDATPASLASAVETSSIRRTGIREPSVSRTTSSGPFRPGP